MSTLCHRGTDTRVGATVASLGRFRPGARELALILALYAAYSLGRVFASGDVGAAVSHAGHLLDAERLLHLDVEHLVNDLFADHRWLAVPASFYYAAAHYVVTPLVLGWLWVSHRHDYAPARRALVGATVVALLLYIAVPTAPPRLVGGYHDLLASTADLGWWSTSASAPQGLGGLTNQLAAMPSMHVGWALWSALALHSYAVHRGLRMLGWLHLATTSLVVLGTGNHWVLDLVAGAALVALAWGLSETDGRRRPRRHDRVNGATPAGRNGGPLSAEVP